MIRFEVEGRPISWNMAHGGVHWAVRKKINDQMKWRTKAALMKYRVPHTQLVGPVEIGFKAYVGRAIDCDNIVLKTYIDGLKDWGLLKDDSPAYVNRITVEVITKNSKKEYISVEIATDVENL